MYDFEKLLGHKYISPEQFLKPLRKLISVYVSKRTGRKENTSLENTLINDKRDAKGFVIFHRMNTTSFLSVGSLVHARLLHTSTTATGPSHGLKIQGVTKYCGGHNLPPRAEIRLTVLSETGGMYPPAPQASDSPVHTSLLTADDFWGFFCNLYLQFIAPIC